MGSNVMKKPLTYLTAGSCLVAGGICEFFGKLMVMVFFAPFVGGAIVLVGGIIYAIFVV